MKTLKEFLNQDANEKRQEKRTNFLQRSKDLMVRMKQKASDARQKGKEQIQKNRETSYADLERMRQGG